MKSTLHEVAGMLVYVFEFVIGGEKRSVILKPLDAANGLIVEETFPDSGIYYGESITGRRVEIPVPAVTNCFASWWKISTKNFGGNGWKTVYGDEKYTEKYLDQVDPPNPETGEYENTKLEKKDPPPDARRYRG